jgi:hypothetical protein
MKLHTNISHRTVHRHWVLQILLYSYLWRASAIHVTGVHYRAVNMLNITLVRKHDPVFFKYKPAVLSNPPDKEYLSDFLNLTWRRTSYCHDNYIHQRVAHALRVHNCEQAPEANHVYSYPLVGEEYFEYIDILKSVDDYTKSNVDRPYSIIEVGCGYCHWTATALQALRQRGTFPFTFVALDGGAVQVERCKDTLHLNSISPATGLVLHAAVTDSGDQNVSFSAADSFGGHINQNSDVSVASINLTQILLLANSTVVDILDVDIQGFEEYIFSSHIDQLSSRVKLIHIGTHGTLHEFQETAYWVGNEIESVLKNLFEANGWTVRHYFPRTSPVCSVEHLTQTAYGSVCFADGVLSLENRRFQS